MDHDEINAHIKHRLYYSGLETVYPFLILFKRNKVNFTKGVARDSIKLN